MSSYQFLTQISTDGKVSNFDLQLIFDKGYDLYDIILNIDDASGDGYIGLTFFDASNTRITQGEYSLAGSEMKSNTSFDNTWRAHNNTQIAPIMSGGKANAGGGALIRIFNADNANSYTLLTAQSSQPNASNVRGTKTIGSHERKEKISGVRFTGHSHTYAMTATIYGIK